MLTIYGSSSCSACKTLLQMAKAQGLDPVYKLIDQDDQARAEYDARSTTSRELPLAVLQGNTTRTETAGLQSCMSLLKAAKE
jgi:glutaredoxin